ncbi:MAG: cobalamin-dependent protein [Gemmatimonadaceae bacterium]
MTTSPGNAGIGEGIGEGIGAGAALAAAIEAHAQTIAEQITTRQFADDPTLDKRFGARGRSKCTEDANRHLSYLATAAVASSDKLFVDYVGWAKILLAKLNMPHGDLARNLTLMRIAVTNELGTTHGAAAARIIDAGLGALPALPESRESFLSRGDSHADLARRYLEMLVAGNRKAASTLVHSEVASGVSIHDIYIHIFQRTQYEIGRRWQMNQMTVAEEHYCTAATQMIMSELYPQIFTTSRVGRRLVAACVGGDLHEIGVRMVADFFEMAGWDTYYLGANMPIQGILQAVEANDADVLAISATMTYHVPVAAEVIRAVRSSDGASPQILVGGYPFRVDTDLWRMIGADGCAADADTAVELANSLVARTEHA